MARRLMTLLSLALGLVLLVAAPALACGGLVAPGHAEVLRKATTLAAWHDGFEHYVTGFEFAGGANRFGYIIPLPGNPSKIQKAGAWTLERLEREINPVNDLAFEARASAPHAAAVQILQKVTIEALDITVVRGGGPDVAKWAEANGFALTPDTPKVLAQYSDRGAIFALARFNNKAAIQRGLAEGQGTVIHFTIPTKAPWIPLRILALGKVPNEQVQADLFILTDHEPKVVPPLFDMSGVKVVSNGWAGHQLLADLRVGPGHELASGEGHVVRGAFAGHHRGECEGRPFHRRGRTSPRHRRSRLAVHPGLGLVGHRAAGGRFAGHLAGLEAGPTQAPPRPSGPRILAAVTVLGGELAVPCTRNPL